MTSLKEIATLPECFTAGHRACAGCGFPHAVRFVLKAAENPVVVSCATGCLEVTSTVFPYTAWDCNFIHTAFETAASTISGVEAAYRALSRQGRIHGKIDFIAFAGDGGTYDIGFQALSGAVERGHDFLFVCYDNQAYANTGIQRSGATPRGAATTTTPAGTVSSGKPQRRKDITAIMAAHAIPYAAQAAISHWADLMRKTKKALAKKGPAFLAVMAPCRLSWAIPSEDTVDIVKHAVDCCFWPLYEVDEGEWRLNYCPKGTKSYRDWLKRQGRFRHLFDGAHEELLADLEEEVQVKWQTLLRKCDAAE